MKSKKKKKVLMIATYFPPSGGVGVFRITKFVKYLKLAGYEPVVVTIDNKYCINRDDGLLKDVEGIKVYRLNFSVLNNSVEKSFKKALNKGIYNIVDVEKPDILFLTGGPFKILPIGRKVYDKYKIPYIIDLRDPWSLQKNNGTNAISRLKIRVYRYIESICEKRTLEKASYTCVVNDTMKKEYEKKYPNYKFAVISNGYDEDDFANIKPVKYKKFTIVYTGKFSVSAGFRNPDTFFQALCHIDGVEFLHVGNIEQNIVDMTNYYNCGDKCKFVGFKSYNEVLSYAKGADALLLISGNEPSEQTGKIFDYMGCNVPIIALTNKNNEIYKICNNLDNVLVVDRNDVNAIISAVKQIKDGKLKSANRYNNIIYSRKYLCNELIELIEKSDQDA